ncbi:TPA: hypothetical protein P2R03_000265 [Aeromonas veronii]|nr:hypothetical protein [Aeromonas veronii]
MLKLERNRWFSCSTICFSRSIELHEKVNGAFMKGTISTDWRLHLYIQSSAIACGIFSGETSRLIWA